MSKNIIDQYAEMEDFGFSAVPDAEDVETIKNQASSDKNYFIEKLEEAENLILPLLSKLAKTADESDTIYWPNRKKIIEQKIEELLQITRGHE